MEYSYEWFVNDLENPYDTPPDRPFIWKRLRVLGGRSLVWGRQSYRLSDVDFKAATRDGYDVDWPFSYAALAPFYDIVENYVGISGAPEKNEMLPDGQFLPAMKMSCGEIRPRDSIKKKFGRTLTIGRGAILTQPHNGRAPCHYCGPCERGCFTFSYFSSPFMTVKHALKTGNCTLITDAIIGHVDMDTRSNKAQGVTFVHRTTKEAKQVRGKAVILCAPALESTRILLNSSTREYPKGLANSSGTLDELSKPEVNRYVDSVAWHVYKGTVDAMTRVHEAFPNKHAQWTEGGAVITSPDFQTDWSKWAATFAGVLKNWGCSIVGWNLALDEQGKPNMGPGQSGGIVTIHSKTQEITLCGQYWAFAHYSKVMQRGARVLASHGELANISHVAVENPAGSYVLVLANQSGVERLVPCSLGSYELRVKLPQNSVATLVW